MGAAEKTPAQAIQGAETPAAVWPAGGWYEGRYAGREAFGQLLRDGLAAAAHAGVAELILSDPDFSDWPLGERAVVQSLNDWALTTGQGRVTLLAASYDEVVRRHARFVQWRVQWAHKIECRRWREGDAQELPSLLWTLQWAMRRDDLERCTGLATCDPRSRVALRERIGEWLRRSAAGFPASVAGL
ncbi:MAG: hypothetical protein LBH10_00130 [Burkholderiaceae bacterium]|jgi:hypothetical protein|nr:hypothetical protein [Burkholderiaceae bacterium]